MHVYIYTFIISAMYYSVFMYVPSMSHCVVGASFCAAARNHKSKLPGLPMVPSTLTIAFKESKCTTYIYIIYMYIVYINVAYGYKDGMHIIYIYNLIII